MSLLTHEASRASLDMCDSVAIMRQNNEAPAPDRDMLSVIIAAAHFADLARLARVCAAAALLVRAELVRRCGRRNIELMAAPDTVTYDEVADFALSVTDPEAIWPIAVRLIPHFDRDHDWGISGIYYVRSGETLFSRWIHLGLIGCARLLGDSSDEFLDRYSACEYHPAEEPFWAVINTMYYWASITSSSLRSELDALDGPHFSLIADLFIAHGLTGSDDFEKLIASNEARPRYDGGFAARVNARWGGAAAATHCARMTLGPPMPLDRARRCSDQCTADCSNIRTMKLNV